MNTDELTPIGEEIDKVLSKLIEMQRERALMIDTARREEIRNGENTK